MKNLIKNSLVLLISLISFGVYSQNCQAALTVTPTGNPGEFTFADASTNMYLGSFRSDITVNLNTTFFIQGITSETVQYSTNGVYTYSYMIWGPGYTCTDSISGLITVTGVNSNPCTLQAGLNITPGTNPGDFILSDNSSGGANFSYFDNGFGPSTLLLPNTSATVSYPSNGIYNYSYIVTDTNSNCYDTLVGTLTVSGMNQGCNANFILLQDSLNPSQYYCWNTSTGSSPAAALTYLWDFGDGNTSNLAYPTHTYNSLGIFTLCLTITETGANCTSTYCDTIIVSVKASGTTLNVLPAGTNLGVEEQNLINSLILYPNPSKGKFTIELEATNSSAVDISIVNLAGQTLYKEAKSISLGNNKISITDNDLADGTYLVSISNRNTGEAKTLRLVKN